MTLTTEPVRLAIFFELCDRANGLTGLGRPQDFRVKSAKWQYTEMKTVTGLGTQHERVFQVFVYARRWTGEGKDFKELDHDQHPTEEEMAALVMQYIAALGGGLPISSPDRQREPMAWNDPLLEDDFLDESDNPDDFEYWEPVDDFSGGWEEN